MKHLNICPAPRINLPTEVRDLALYYREIENSIIKIKETIGNLAIDELLTEIQTLTTYLTKDITEIFHTLD